MTTLSFLPSFNIVGIILARSLGTVHGFRKRYILFLVSYTRRNHEWCRKIETLTHVLDCFALRSAQLSQSLHLINVLLKHVIHLLSL